ANNPSGGGAAEGMGLGMGFAMANRMAGGAGVIAPPPVPGGEWHIAVNGQSQGPWTLQQLAQGIAGGRVTRDTLVWSAGMAGWTTAKDVPQLSELFSTSAGAAVPPPPPHTQPGS